MQKLGVFSERLFSIDSEKKYSNRNMNRQCIICFEIKPASQDISKSNFFYHRLLEQYFPACKGHCSEKCFDNFNKFVENNGPASDEQIKCYRCGQTKWALRNEQESDFYHHQGAILGYDARECKKCADFCFECGKYFGFLRQGAHYRHESWVHDFDPLDRYPLLKCDLPNCCTPIYQTRDKLGMQRHQQQFHDVGDNRCEICTENHFLHADLAIWKCDVCNWIKIKSDNKRPRHEHAIHESVVKACKKCQSKSRREHECVARLKILMPGLNDYIFSLDRPLKKLGGSCAYRPDVIIKFENVYVILEFDEDQHWTYKKENERTEAVFRDTFFEDKPVVMIRLNADKIKHTFTRVSMDEREQILKYILTRLLIGDLDIKQRCIIYICYSETNGNISTEYEHKNVFSVADVQEKPWTKRESMVMKMNL